MADKPKPGVEGEVNGHPISQSAQSKIQDVLKTTLQQELTTQKPAAGTVVGGHHGSIYHGSVYFEETAVRS